MCIVFYAFESIVMFVYSYAIIGGSSIGFGASDPIIFSKKLILKFTQKFKNSSLRFSDIL